MKNLKITLSGLFLILFTTFNVAQSEMPMLSVFKEEVKPSAHLDYLRATKAWVATLKQEGMIAPNWMTFSSDFTYYYVMPIKNMADMDKNPFAEVEKKMGKEKFKQLMEQFDPQVTSKHQYIIKHDPGMSYLPEGTTADGENYREFITFYVKPENMEKVENLAGIIKSLFERKNSKFPYASYRSGLGAIGPYIMVAQWAKNPLEFEKKRMANNELLGEEFANLYNKLLSYCSKVEFREGMYHPDFSNPPASNAPTADSNK